MGGEVWDRMLYHLTCSTPLSFVFWRDCLYRSSPFWFSWCLFRSCHDDTKNTKMCKDNHEQPNRMCQHEGNGFSTCLEGFCALVHTKPSKQVEKPFPSHWRILLGCSWLSLHIFVFFVSYHVLAKTSSSGGIRWLIPP